MSNIACCFTGHRIIPAAEKEIIKEKLRKRLEELVKEKGVTLFIAGGALGFDTLAALEVLSLRERYPDVKLRLAIPCDEQTKGWRMGEVELYRKIMEKADEVVYTSHAYTSGCMHLRNRYMVDNAEYCIAYMTKPSGGTAYTVKYAEKNGISVINLADL